MPMLLMDGQTGEYAFSLPMVVIVLLCPPGSCRCTLRRRCASGSWPKSSEAAIRGNINVGDFNNMKLEDADWNDHLDMARHIAVVKM